MGHLYHGYVSHNQMVKTVMFQFAILVMTPEGSYVNGRLTVALPRRLRPGHPDGKGAAGRAAEA